MASSVADRQRTEYLQNIETVSTGAKITFMGFLVGNVLGFAHNIIIARYLGPELLGLYKIGTQVLQYVLPLSTLGLFGGVVYFNSKFHEAEAYHRMKGVLKLSFALTIGIGLLLLGLLLAFSKEIALAFGKPDLVGVVNVLALSLPFITAGRILGGSFNSIKNVRYPVYASQIAGPSAKVILELGVVIAGLGLFGILGVHVVVSALTVLILAVLHRQAFRFLRDHQARYRPKELLSYSTPLLFSSYMYMIISSLDILMLGYFDTSENVGVYSVAVALAAMLLVPLKSFNVIFSPIISRLVDQSELGMLGSLFKTITRWIFTLSLPVALIFIVFSNETLLIFGEAYTNAGIALGILAVAQLINAMSGSVGKIVVMSGRSKLGLANNTLLALTNFGLNLWLIPKYSILGAALATGISITLLMIVVLIEVFVLLGIHPYERDYWKPALAGGILCLIFLIISGLHVFETAALLFLGALIVALGAYGLVLYLLGLKEEDKEFLRHMFYSLP